VSQKPSKETVPAKSSATSPNEKPGVSTPGLLVGVKISLLHSYFKFRIAHWWGFVNKKTLDEKPYFCSKSEKAQNGYFHFFAF